jgi:hypothetical protein
LLSTTTAEEESTDRTEAMPGGSRVGCVAVLSLALRALAAFAFAPADFAAAPEDLVLIATRSP